MLQAFSALGNITAALVGLTFNSLERAAVLPFGAWRWMFAVGILPSLLALIVISRLKEPERWRRAVTERAGKRQAGSLSEMFGDPKWRSRAIAGVILASAGVIGLWSIGFFSMDLNQSVFRRQYQQAGRLAGQAEIDRQLVRAVVETPQLLDTAKKALDKIQSKDLLSLDATNNDPQALYAAALALHEKRLSVSVESVLSFLDQKGEKDKRPAQSSEERYRRTEYLAGAPLAPGNAEVLIADVAAWQKKTNGNVGWWGSITSMMFNAGAFFGIYSFSLVTQRIGRRLAFAIFFLAAMLSTAFTFLFLNGRTDVFWMVPLMGFCQLSVFGGYAIYFPELFPTRLRSTGTSFCYNIGRFAAASGPLALGLLTTRVYAGYPEPLPFRYAGVTMCAIFLLGIAVLPFVPETKGQPLPE